MSGDGLEPMQLTTGEREELLETLEHLEPVERDRGILVYHNSDGTGPMVRSASDAVAESLLRPERTPDRSSGQPSEVSTPKKVGALVLVALILAYSLLITQTLVLGILASGIVYMAMTGQLRKR